MLTLTHTHTHSKCCNSYIVVRRKNQSFFIKCHAGQTIFNVKQELCTCLINDDKQQQQQQLTPESLQLCNTEKEVFNNDEIMLSSLKNQEELYLCLPISDGEEQEWEPIEVTTMPPLGDDHAASSSATSTSAPMQE
jgi:DNA mismatch repair ATPase MutL